MLIENHAKISENNSSFYYLTFYFILFYLFYLIIKPEKNSGLNEIRTHDLCDTGAVFYQLNYQAIWELAMHFVNSKDTRRR